MFCKNCGNKLDDDALFCMSCGVKLADDISLKYCPHCGGELESDAVFCMNCGKRILENQNDSEAEAKSDFETANAKEEAAKQTGQNVKPVIVPATENAGGKTENITLKKNIEKITKDNRKKNIIIWILLGINIFLLEIICAGLYFQTKQKATEVASAQKNSWVDDAVFNLDVLNAKIETITYDNGNKEIVACYNISKSDFKKLWDSISKVTLIYAASKWRTGTPVYSKIDDYICF